MKMLHNIFALCLKMLFTCKGWFYLVMAEYSGILAIYQESQELAEWKLIHVIGYMGNCVVYVWNGVVLQCHVKREKATIFP